MILLDVQLPDAAGADWLRQRKSEETPQQIPLVMMTMAANKRESVFPVASRKQLLG